MGIGNQLSSCIISYVVICDTYVVNDVINHTNDMHAQQRQAQQSEGNLLLMLSKSIPVMKHGQTCEEIAILAWFVVAP